MRFLAIGECMAELAPTGEPGGFRLGFAGDTFNTAWYLARLCPQMPVAYLSAIGTDAISQRMGAAIAQSGIDCSFLRQVPDRSVGLYMISLENGERSFCYWRGESAARELARDAAALADAMAAADTLYFSGITLAILDAPSRHRLLEALAGARAAGKSVVFDPNLRPRLWADAGEMREAIMQGAAVSDMVLPSFEDEAEWFDDADPPGTARRYAAAGADRVVVKDGAGPVHFLDGGAAGRVSVARLAQVVDSTAAGDSFNAALLAGLAQRQPLAPSIESACRLAARVVQGKGALVPVEAADMHT